MFSKDFTLQNFCAELNHVHQVHAAEHMEERHRLKNMILYYTVLMDSCLDYSLTLGAADSSERNIVVFFFFFFFGTMSCMPR